MADERPQPTSRKGSSEENLAKAREILSRISLDDLLIIRRR